MIISDSGIYKNLLITKCPIYKHIMAQYSWYLNWGEKWVRKGKPIISNLGKKILPRQILALNFKSCSRKNIWIYIHELC